MKTIQHFVIAILAMIWGVIFVSCSDDEKNGPEPSSQPPIEDFDQGNMNFTASASARSFTFKANTAWSVSVAETSSGVAWCTVSPAAGEAGEQKVTVYVDANYALDDRSVTLTLKAGSEKKTFVVTQKPMGALLLTSDKYEVDPQGGTITVEVKANVDYTATVSEACKDWIKEVADTKGLTTTTKSYQISANKNEKKREGMIFFSDGELRDTVHVYQAVGDVILLTRNEYYADAAGEEITVELRSNCEYEVVMPSVDWIHEITTRAMSSHTLRYTVDANPDYDSREAIIVYKDLNGSTSDTLTIIQAQKDAIVLGEKEYTANPEGEIIEVKVASNVEYDINIESSARSWISEVENNETKALVENKHYFNIARCKKASHQRVGHISFSGANGVQDRVTVIQSAPSLEISSEKEIQLENTSQTFEVNIKSNVKFDVTVQADWISQTDLNTNGEESIVTFSVNENTESSQRSAEIIFSNEKCYLEETLSVIQQGGLLVVTVKTAGTLKQLIEDYKNVQSLKVSGPLNGTDINLLQDMGEEHNLISLDLSEASIVSGGEYYYYTTEAKYTTDNEIGEYMFVNAKFEKVVLPNNITKIGVGSFGCPNLKEINIPESVMEVGGISSKAGLKIKIPNLTAWCNIDFSYNPLENKNSSLYLNDELITDLHIPEGITMIKKNAFRGYDKLTNVSIPSGVIEIGDNAFEYCANLNKVEIANTVTKIKDFAFSQCSSLAEMNIPNSVTEIGFRAFNGCSNLVKVSLPDNLRIIDSQVFTDCVHLKEISIPNSITEIGDNAFAGCRSLVKFDIPTGVTRIAGSAFENCESLTEINVPNGIIKIEYDTFRECINLESITIGNAVIEIGDYAFCNVPLKKFYIHTVTPPAIDDTSFKSTNYVESTLYVPKGCVQAYTDAGWGNYFYNIVEMDE